MTRTTFSAYRLEKLSAYVSVQPGYAFASEKFTDDPSDCPLVKGENVQQGYVDWGAAKYWPQSEIDDFAAYELRAGDVVVAMDRPWVQAGLKWAYIRKDDPRALLVQRVARLTARDGLDQTYLRCLISSAYFAAYVQPIVTGVNVPHISGKQIGDFLIPVPDLPVQRNIAAILSAYDDLIANNQRRIALLEGLAEEIYREWFVRMRFPGYASAKWEHGLPAGWRPGSATEVVNVLGGGTPRTEIPAYWDGDIPFFSPKDSHVGAICTETEQTITEAGLESCASQLFEANTIFITARGTVGNIVLAGKPMAMNQSCYALVPKNGAHLYFVFVGLRCAVSVIKGVSNSGVFDNIVMDTFKIIPMIDPGTELAAKFSNLVKPMFEQSLALRQTNKALRTQRDALLPRLISGKLKVDHLDIRLPPSMRAEAETVA